MNEGVLNDPSPRAFCAFRADARLYGIDVACLREISANTTITPVPRAPPVIRGLANLRSRIFLILDLRALLGLPPAPCTADSRLIILKPTVAEDMGLLADRGGDILTALPDRIASVDAALPMSDAPSADQARSLVVGMCKLENELMMIIDAVRLADTVARATTNTEVIR
jgi:purine-binding chemotaxis protein CheW